LKQELNDVKMQLPQPRTSRPEDVKATEVTPVQIPKPSKPQKEVISQHQKTSPRGHESKTTKVKLRVNPYEISYEFWAFAIFLLFGVIVLVSVAGAN
jgi:hypothetical protein